MKRLWWSFFVLITLGCSLTRFSDEESKTPLPTEIETSVGFPVQDAGWLLETACYEAMNALHNQVVVLSDNGALEAFYNSLDTYCETPVQRRRFDFATQELVVAVMVVKGCDAQFVPKGIENNNLMLQFVEEGDCPYDVIATYAGSIAKPASGELKVTITDA